jgi:nitronate monooxygenase
MNAAATALAQQLGCAHPLIQAPMAGVQGSALALAVCSAGALGSLPAAMLSTEQLRSELQALQQGCAGRPYNVNFFCHQPPTPDEAAQARWREALAPYCAEFGIDPAATAAGPGRAPFSPEALALVLAQRVPVVSFHFGLPAPALLAPLKAAGVFILSSATTVEEGLWLQQHGADAVIAQGLEAGGHRGLFLTDDLSTQLGTMALTRQLVQALQVPVIAAGGMADAPGVAAALALGAAGVQVGTAYLCANEASTSALHRAALRGPAARHTALTNLFTGRPARGIVNRLMRELGPLSPLAPAFPLATAAVAPLRAAAEQAGSADFSPLWAGQNPSGCVQAGAAEITAQLLRGFAPA